jgi:hypothetical protein
MQLLVKSPNTRIILSRLHGGRDMIYKDIKISTDISSVISIIKKDFKNLAQLTFPTTYETTMGQNKVLTIYLNLQPAIKVEGPEDLLDVLKEVLEEEKEKFYLKH